MDFDNTILNIANYFGLEIPENIKRPNQLGWFPWKSKCGASLKYWSKENLQLFDEVTDSFRIPEIKEKCLC